MTLTIGTIDNKPLNLPLDSVTQKFAFIGRTGQGKTYAASKQSDTKICIDCPATFERTSETPHQWGVVKRCPNCTREHLKLRLKSRTVIDANGCWLWQATLRNGYGVITVNDRQNYCHRLSFELFNGKNPEGLVVCHKCDVRQCLNPEHLFLGTQSDNMQDAKRKGRASAPPVHFGEQHPLTTLTDAQVAEIRSKRADGVSQRKIAKEYGCSQSTVWRLTHNLYRTQS